MFGDRTVNHDREICIIFVPEDIRHSAGDGHSIRNTLNHQSICRRITIGPAVCRICCTVAGDLDLKCHLVSLLHVEFTLPLFNTDIAWNRNIKTDRSVKLSGIDVICRAGEGICLRHPVALCLTCSEYGSGRIRPLEGNLALVSGL